MSNTNTVPSILPSMDYHRGMYDFYLDSVDSLKENVQYPNGYFYPSTSTQNSPHIPGMQWGTSFTHFEYPRPHFNQIYWDQSQNIQDYHGLNRFHPHNVPKRDSPVSPVDPLDEPRGDQFGLPCDPWDPAPAELQDLDSILAAYQGNEAEQSKPFNDLTQIGNQNQIRGQNVINNSQMTSIRPYDLPAALQLSSAQPVYPVPPALPHVSSKTAPRKSNGARGLKTFNCTACEKWFTSSGHLKRHYSTSIHKNSVRTSGRPDPAAAAASPRRAAPPAPHTLPPFSHLRGNPYSSGSFDTSGTAVPEPQYSPVYLGQNQHHMTPNHPNATGPEVIDILVNNPTTAKPDLSSDTSPESGDVLSHRSVDSLLPSFAQPQAHRFGTDASPFFNRMDQHREDCSDSNLVEEFISICVPLTADVMEEKTKQQLQMFKHEPVTGPESTKAGDTSVSPPHECRACGKRFSRACSLTQHNNSSHSGARLFKCARCGKRFADEAARARHGARHVGRKPFGCAACPKSFNHKSDLRRHMCLHAADKPFACALCGKGFVRRDHMLKHVNTHAKRVTRDPSSSSSSTTPPST